MDHLKPNSDNTEQLLQQAQAGDEQAFENLFARHRAYLHQVVAMRLDPRMRPRLDPWTSYRKPSWKLFNGLAIS